MKSPVSLISLLLLAPAAVWASPVAAPVPAPVDERAGHRVYPAGAARGLIAPESNDLQRRAPAPAPGVDDMARSSECIGSTSRECQPAKRFNDIRAISGGVPPPADKRAVWLRWWPF